MNCQNNRFIFELAAPEDGQELLEILEEAEFRGRISLLYTRRPDACLSLKQEGKEVDAVVCRDTRNGKIVGFGACALRELFVNGKAATVGYLFSLRVRREYQRKYPLLHRGYKLLRQHHRDKGVSFYLTTILEENRAAQRLLGKRRPFMPHYRPYGRYEVYALHCRRSSSTVSSSLKQAAQADLPDLLAFLSEQGKTMQFFPVLNVCPGLWGTSGMTLTPNIPSLMGAEGGKKRSCHKTSIIERRAEGEFYLLRDKHQEILAAGAIWDQQNYKQYVMQGYSGIFKLLRPLSRLFPLFGFPVLPKTGEMLNFFTLSFWAVKNQTPVIFAQFLDAISGVAGTYPFFLLGVHENHPLRSVLTKRPHIKYTSQLYLVSWDHQEENVKALDKHIVPYLECGML